MQLQHSLHLNLESGVSLAVDLSHVPMTQEQHAIVQKLIANTKHIDSAECTKEGCPAQKVLNPGEFEKIRDLKATLGPTSAGAKVAGPIIDFCLHVVNVGEVAA